MKEKLEITKKWGIFKFANDEAFKRGEYFEHVTFDGNMLLNEGIDLLEDLLIGAGGTAYNNANARLGVGDSSVAEAATQTGLQGTNKAYAPMDTGFPSRTGETVRWQAIFDGNTANFDWNEFTIVNAIDDTGTNLNRKVSAQGTKASGQTWTLYIDVTIS